MTELFQHRKQDGPMATWKCEELAVPVQWINSWRAAEYFGIDARSNWTIIYIILALI
jgi:hypothetical protein